MWRDAVETKPRLKSRGRRNVREAAGRVVDTSGERGGESLGYFKNTDAKTQKRGGVVLPDHLARLLRRAVARGDSSEAVGLALAAMACGASERLPLGDQGGQIDVGDDRRHGVLRIEISLGVSEF